VTTALSEKYEVRKDGIPLPPGTYFVLRSGDQYAYAALWQYGQVLQLALELQTLTDEERERVRDLQGVVEALAETWQAAAKKIPD